MATRGVVHLNFENDFLLWMLDYSVNKSDLTIMKAMNVAYLMDSKLKSMGINLGYGFEEHYAGMYSKDFNQDIFTAHLVETVEINFDGMEEHIRASKFGHDMVERHIDRYLEEVVGRENFQNLERTLVKYSRMDNEELAQVAKELWKRNTDQRFLYAPIISKSA